jgi:hypothetical protein
VNSLSKIARKYDSLPANKKELINIFRIEKMIASILKILGLYE